GLVVAGAADARKGAGGEDIVVDGPAGKHDAADHGRAKHVLGGHFPGRLPMRMLIRILGLPCRVTLRSDTRTHSPCVQDGVTSPPSKCRWSRSETASRRGA